MQDHLPQIIGLLSDLRRDVKTTFEFSNKVFEVPLGTLLAGHVRTTYGTDFDCIAMSILDRGFDKAVVLTDGYASMEAENAQSLKQHRLRTLTVLFGGKTDCEEFARFGDVLQLEEITN